MSHTQHVIPDREAVVLDGDPIGIGRIPESVPRGMVGKHVRVQKAECSRHGVKQTAALYRGGGVIRLVIWSRRERRGKLGVHSS